MDRVSMKPGHDKIIPTVLGCLGRGEEREEGEQLLVFSDFLIKVASCRRGTGNMYPTGDLRA